MSIKIISGWSRIGGSTIAFVNLTNAFNSFGIDCTFYGPHNWHLDKCKSGTFNNYNLPFNENDILIVHFLHLPKRLDCRKFIFSSHEMELFNLNKINYKIYDKIHFVSEHQKQFHNLNHPTFVIPNIISELSPNPKRTNKKIAGILGSIDRNKQTLVSIKKALDDNCDMVVICGRIDDQKYYDEDVAPFINKNKEKVVYLGIIDNKQEMYDLMTDVYCDSQSETYGYLPIECEMTKTIFHGTDAYKKVERKTKQEIVNIWRKELEI